ncbi:MAG: hypothetical protein HYX94_04090 [Chloroflexi bacterium]|nr:hypothetical protein [Chloroflexota bacterium]
MLKKVFLTLTTAFIAWLLVACATPTGAPNGGERSPLSSPSPEPTVPPGAQEAVTAAKRDLAGRTGNPTDKLSLVSVEEVQWRDASLGCPEPGKFYAQVITPGYRIVLHDGARQYEYHSDRGGRIVLCSGGR